VLRRGFGLTGGTAGGVSVGGGVGAGIVDVVKDELGLWIEELSLPVGELLLLVTELEGVDDSAGTTVVVTPTVSTALLFSEKVLAGASPLKETNVTPTGVSTPSPLTGALTRLAWHATGKF